MTKICINSRYIDSYFVGIDNYEVVNINFNFEMKFKIL